MTTISSDLLKFSAVQMAAEADYLGVVEFQNRLAIQAALIRGNNRSSKFTEIQAEKFTDALTGWSVVDHVSNTTTGFSGTLFKSNETGEFVLSFRSTEFADDAARDNQATNTLEIKEHGWAFGQIADMEAWFQGLKDSGKLPPYAVYTVTGYSLGGHLATAFNLLRQQDGTAQQITSTYTFNGAGVLPGGDGQGVGAPGPHHAGRDRARFRGGRHL
ncbi:hypothetical protein [Hydrogenophaga sp. 2FB]|uniref:hypothetical protein n=1 Tax=Hydrogenophaga sp. 2FB TaxID=2502187 RepID=UPI0010F44E83|nr:hypothetical protein [Hydrogenophaga sp. 2FB]